MLKQVIIIGGGLSGLSAAHSVLEIGGKVLLLDKNPFCGGNSTKATSGINAALTKTQLLKGVDDSAELFEKDTARSANLGKSDKTYPLATVLAKDSDPAVEWLTGKFGIDLSLISRLGGHSHPRTHRGKERFPGMTITYALLETLEDVEKKTKGVDAKILTKAKVTKLISENDHVIGVEYEHEGKVKQAYGVVVIATGGFGCDYTSTSLMKKFRPDLEKIPTTNGSHCTGDGIKIAANLGADMVDMEWVQVHPTGLVHPDDPNAKVKWLAAEALRGVGGILLDANGNRFCDELGRRDYVTGEMNTNKGPFRLVLNSKAGKEIEWHCKHYIGRQLMKRFENAEGLAKELGVKVENIKNTFDKYNECASKGTDQYGKKFFTNAPFTTQEELFVSVVCPVVHYCMGGIKINPDTEVVKPDDKAIPGLFAAGEVAGGIHGKNRLGGNSLLECVVFGRIAGRNAAKYLMKISLDEKKYSGISRIELVRNQLSNSSSAKNVPELLKLSPSKTESRVSGGTSEMLPAERAKSKFNLQDLIDYINGGKELTKRRKFIENGVSKDPELLTKVYNHSRSESLSEGVNEFVRIHKPFKTFKPTRWDICVMADIGVGYGALNNSHGIFAATIAGQGNEEQQKFWLPKIWNFEITGSYAQTELGHGSNVRGLQTIAEYDKKSDEFILNTPTLRAMKWWPGCLGKIATHVVLYAQTLVDGKENGVDVFILQIRDENHLPLPGVRL
jgi:flavocytochrome c